MMKVLLIVENAYFELFLFIISSYKAPIPIDIGINIIFIKSPAIKPITIPVVTPEVDFPLLFFCIFILLAKYKFSALQQHISK